MASLLSAVRTGMYDGRVLAVTERCTLCGRPLKRIDFFADDEHTPVLWCTVCTAATPAPPPPVQRLRTGHPPLAEAHDRSDRVAKFLVLFGIMMVPLITWLLLPVL